MFANSFIIQESAIPVKAQSIRSKNDGSLEFVCTLQEADRKNRNGRIYPKRVLEEAIAGPYIQERLRTRTLFAECGHPLDTSVARQMTIDARNSVCLIEEMWWEGNLLKGKCVTLNTQLGRDFKAMIEQGCIVAFSLRAQGNVRNDAHLGAMIVESPISICTFDFVINPSHDVAFLDYICEDSYKSLIKPDAYATKSIALCEAANLYENGAMIAMNESKELKHVDYTKSYGKAIKTLNETYIREDIDEFISLSEDKQFVTLRNDKVEKKVLTEDFLVKDIRNKIRGI